MLCLQLVNYFHIHDLPWFSQQSWKERRKEGRKKRTKSYFCLGSTDEEMLLPETHSWEPGGNRAGSPDVCQDCSHSEPKLSSGYMPQAGTLRRSFSIDYLISFAQLPMCCWGGWETKAQKGEEQHRVSKLVPLKWNQPPLFHCRNALECHASCPGFVRNDLMESISH